MTETKRAEETKKERRLEKAIELAAPVDEVWKALTDPKELVKWFPLEARITPGVGGKIFLSWGPGCEGEAEIVTWEPGKKFAWREKLAVAEWTLEARDGKTVVRLVQSGFVGESDGEKEWFESTSYGWGFMLASLRWALERHRGEERQVAWPRVKASIPREEAYRRLMSAGGLFVADARANLKAGGEYALRAKTGENLSGRVEFVNESRGFCLTVREMKDALLWLTIEGEPGKIEVQVWLSAFGLPEAKVKEFSGRWEERLRAILAA